jgi:hypothetical protein
MEQTLDQPLTWSYRVNIMIPLGCQVGFSAFTDARYNGITLASITALGQIAQIRDQAQQHNYPVAQVQDRITKLGEITLVPQLILKDFVQLIKEMQDRVRSNQMNHVVNLTFVRPPRSVSIVQEHKEDEQGQDQHNKDQIQDQVQDQGLNINNTAPIPIVSSLHVGLSVQPALPVMANTQSTSNGQLSDQDRAERLQKKQEEQRLEQEQRRIKQERKQAEQERKRAEQEKKRVRQEKKRAEQERRRRFEQEQRARREEEKIQGAKDHRAIKEVIYDSVQLLQCMESYLNVLDGTVKKHYVSKASLSNRDQLAYDRFIVLEIAKQPVPLTDAAVRLIGKKWRENVTAEEKQDLGKSTPGQNMFAQHHYAAAHPPMHTSSPHKRWAKMVEKVKKNLGNKSIYNAIIAQTIQSYKKQAETCCKKCSAWWKKEAKDQEEKR